MSNVERFIDERLTVAGYPSLPQRMTLSTPVFAPDLGGLPPIPKCPVITISSPSSTSPESRRPLHLAGLEET